MSVPSTTNGNIQKNNKATDKGYSLPAVCAAVGFAVFIIVFALTTNPWFGLLAFVSFAISHAFAAPFAAQVANERELNKK